MRLKFGLTAPVVFVANVFRNAILVLMIRWYPNSPVAGMSMWEFTHTWTSKLAFGLLLFFLISVAFAVFPQLHHNVRGLFTMHQWEPPISLEDEL